MLRLLRIELNQSLCDYYTELDAVYLTGTRPNDNVAWQRAIDNSIDYLNFTTLSIIDFSTDDEHQTQNQPSIEERERCGNFQVLPVSRMHSFVSQRCDF